MSSVRRGPFGPDTSKYSAIFSLPLLLLRPGAPPAGRSETPSQPLNSLALSCNMVRLVWVPSHTGILGNERADSLAKLGTTADAPESPYLPLHPLFFLAFPSALTLGT